MTTANGADLPGIDEVMERIDRARAVIAECTDGATDVRGIIPCPICGSGRIRYGISGPKRHIHARCSTPECVWWME